MHLRSNDGLRVAGRSRLCAYPAGTLRDYLDNAKELPTPLYETRSPNLVVSTGKGLVGDLLLDVESVGLTYHAIGTGTTAPAAGDTALDTEAARKLWTSKTRTGSVITYSVFYLASECAFDIKEVGVFGGSTASGIAESGVLFARLLQSYDNSAGLVDLTFEYELSIG